METIARCLPVYVVVDTSMSMLRFEGALNEALKSLHGALINDPRLSGFVYVSILSYNTAAEIALKMTDPQSVDNFPVLKCGGATNLASALRLLHERIDEDVPHLGRTGRAVLRPVAFLLAGGQPTGEHGYPSDNWKSDLAALMDKSGHPHPDIIPFGYGTVLADTLEEISTIPGCAFRAGDGDTAVAIEKAARALYGTLVASAQAGALRLPPQVDGFSRVSPVASVDDGHGTAGPPAPDTFPPASQLGPISRMLPTMPSGAGEAPGFGGVMDDDVRFTVYRPQALSPGVWASLLVFAHKTDLVEEPGRPPLDPNEQVEVMARAHFGGEATRPAAADARSGIFRGARLRIVPDLPGIQCNPPAAELHWWEPVHQAVFRLRAGNEMTGSVARGAVRVWCGPLLLGEVSLAISIAAVGSAAGSPRVTDSAQRYRKIFPSYSHDDGAIVAGFAEAARALGDQYLQDVLALRAGEHWEGRLLELIEQADVFQLFWSSNSMRSRYCRDEWEYALALRRPSFVRPLYWEEPLPRDPVMGLPPVALQQLHFVQVQHYLALATAQPPAFQPTAIGPPIQLDYEPAPASPYEPAPPPGRAPAPAYGQAPAPAYGQAPAPAYGGQPSAPAPAYGQAPASRPDARPSRFSRRSSLVLVALVLVVLAVLVAIYV